jgi:flavorubredoxin
MKPVEIASNVHWIGVDDKDLDVFDITMKTHHGTTYNSYLIQGSDKVAIVDGVKKQFADKWLENIESIVGFDKIDYLIVNHNEPDHSGGIASLLEKNPNIEIHCGAAAIPYVNAVINREASIVGHKDKTQLELGGKTLTFRLMPYMHWPDTMMDYLEEDKILFSNDGFAAHLSGKSIWGDEATEDVDYEVKYYFDCIMRPFTGFIRRNMKKLDDHEISMVAPSHGPIFRRNPTRQIESYKAWSVDKAENGNIVSIFYASNYGNTKSMADIVGNELNAAGYNVELFDVATTDADLQEQIEKSTAVLVGTPTFNGDAIKPIWEFVNLFSTVYSIGKKAAVFGSYGWGGEGVKMVADRLSSLKLKVYEENCRARLIPSEEEETAIRDWSKQVAEFFR